MLFGSAELLLVGLLLSVVVGIALVAIVLGRSSGRRRRASSEPDALPEDVLGLRQEVAALRSEVRGALRHLAVVRYDAFGDVGGHLSWSMALLDDQGGGVVLTSVHGRSEARSYAKGVRGWQGEQPLSPEEEEAIARARG